MKSKNNVSRWLGASGLTATLILAGAAHAQPKAPPAKSSTKQVVQLDDASLERIYGTFGKGGGAGKGGGDSGKSGKSGGDKGGYGGSDSKGGGYGGGDKGGYGGFGSDKGDYGGSKSGKADSGSGKIGKSDFGGSTAPGKADVDKSGFLSANSFRGPASSAVLRANEERRAAEEAGNIVSGFHTNGVPSGVYNPRTNEHWSLDRDGNITGYDPSRLTDRQHRDRFGDRSRDRRGANDHR